MEKLDDMVQRVARKMYKGSLKDIIDHQMVTATAEDLMKSVVQGYGVGFNNYETEKQFQTLLKLRGNMYRFAGAKNWNFLSEISDLHSTDISFKDFLNGVQKLQKTYYDIYQQIEHNHTEYASSQIAKWEQIEADDEALPFLQYDAVMDRRVREEHAKLNGIIRPIKDEFWKKYYPPNGWNCRCTVRQLDEYDAAHIDHKSLPDKMPVVPLIFQNNVGQTAAPIAETHPYFQRIPKSQKQQVMSTSEKIGRSTDKKRWDILALPPLQQFDLYGTFGDKNVYIHKLKNRGDEKFKQELAEAIYKANQGFDTEMLPELINNEVGVFYHRILPKNEHHIPKNPDFRLTKQEVIYADLKSPTGTGKNTLSDNISKGALQADNIIVELINQRMSKDEAKNIADGEMGKYPSIKTVEVITKDWREVFKRK